MRGKYSPTVIAAYRADQEWHDKLLPKDQWSQYDVDGYDMYGYDDMNIDRAGIQEDDYADVNDGRYLYEDIWSDWGFDGTRPVTNNPLSMRIYE